MRREMGFRPGQPILEAMAELPEGERRAHCLSVLRRHEQEGADRSVLMPGAGGFLAALSRWEVPVAILTRNSRDGAQRTLDKLGLAVSLLVTREEAPPKPDPTGLRLICRRWSMEPCDVLFFGDFLFDLQAGQRAGMPTVLYAPEELPGYAREADFVIRHFDEAHALFDAHRATHG